MKPFSTALGLVLALLGLARSGEAVRANHTTQETIRVIPKQSPDYDPDEEFPSPADFKKLQVPSVFRVGPFPNGTKKDSADGKWLTFKYPMSVKNCILYPDRRSRLRSHRVQTG